MACVRATVQCKTVVVNMLFLITGLAAQEMSHAMKWFHHCAWPSDPCMVVSPAVYPSNWASFVVKAEMSPPLPGGRQG